MEALAGNGQPARHLLSSEHAHFKRVDEFLPPVSLNDLATAGVSEACLLRAIWTVVLARHAGGDEVHFISNFGREPFLLFPLNLRVNADDSFGRWLLLLQRTLSDLNNRNPAESLSSKTELGEINVGVFVVQSEEEFGSLSERLRTRDLALGIFMRLGASQLTIQFAPKAFPVPTIGHLCRHFQTALRNVPHAWKGPIQGLALATEHELRQVLVDWNQTETRIVDGCIHQFFEEQVARTPHAVALVFRDMAFTYVELNDRADKLATLLRSMGVGPGALVAVALDRSPDMVAVLLAVLKAGGAYIPLDATYPTERLHLMLVDARPALAVVSAKTAGKIPPAVCAQLLVEEAESKLASMECRHSDTGVVSGQPAYVIYTSGSTGKPKGVVVTHRNVANFFGGMDHVLGTQPGTWLAVTSVSFDISVLELFWTLTRGFKVVLAEGQLTSSQGAAYSLRDQFRRYDVTHLQCTPSLASILLRDPESVDALAPLRQMILGGEALALDLALKLTRVVSGEVFNMYGPTETTVWSTACRIRGDEDRILIGRPIANTKVYVLDSSRQPVPIGVPGELYIGGAGVAEGYLRRPDLTSDRFLANPFTTDGSRLYRTGDIVRYEADGALEFLGRADQQVKILGFRIELGEIELTLKQHPQLSDAVVVVAKGEKDPNNQRLVAYAIPKTPGAPAGREVRAWLREKLPAAMIPSAVVLVNEFAKTLNGKIDRNALPTPHPDANTRPEQPRNSLEEALAAIWAEALDAESISVTRGFFDLGGHSLLMVDVHDRIQHELGFEISLVDLFQFPTVRSLAEHLGSRQSTNRTASTGAARGRLRQRPAAKSNAPLELNGKRHA